MPEGKPTVSKIPGQSIGPQFSEEGMATFKVGQRCKYVSGLLSPKLPIGAEGTVAGFNSFGYTVNFDLYEDGWEVYSTSIAPLTDPGADAFIERIKRLGREPINDAPKVTVTK
jgi:hypothetical protein